MIKYISIVFVVIAVIAALTSVIISVVLPSVVSSVDQPSIIPNSVGIVPLIPKYDRSAFGNWKMVRGKCDTSEIVRERDSGLTKADLDGDGCFDDGTFIDPYTDILTSARGAHADHVFPVSEAWRQGAWMWSRVDRVKFANDMDNLLLTDSRVNIVKSDKLPSKWRPVSLTGQCKYARIFRATAVRYHFVVRTADDNDLRKMESLCEVR
jgi:hypothetical protein